MNVTAKQVMNFTQMEKIAKVKSYKTNLWNIAIDVKAENDE